MRDVKRLPDGGSLQAEWELPVGAIPGDKIVVLPDTVAMDAIHPMVSAGPSRGTFIGYGSPNVGSGYEYGMPIPAGRPR
jgi:hypothetical protein